MLKTCCTFFVAIITIPVFSQQSRFQFEPSLSGQYVHHIDCKLDDKDPHRGFTVSPGIRLNFDISKRFTLVGAYVIKNFTGEVLYPVEKFYSLDVKYRIGHFERLPSVDFCVESGLGYVRGSSRLSVPFYFGTSMKINPILTWNTRLLLPVGSLITDEAGTFDYAAYGVDMGLAMRLCAGPVPKYTRSGNPFILQ